MLTTDSMPLVCNYLTLLQRKKSHRHGYGQKHRHMVLPSRTGEN